MTVKVLVVICSCSDRGTVVFGIRERGAAGEAMPQVFIFLTVNVQAHPAGGSVSDGTMASDSPNGGGGGELLWGLHAAVFDLKLFLACKHCMFEI